MVEKRTKRKVKIAGFILIVFILFGCWRLLEYVSYRILVSKNILTEERKFGGIIQSSNRLSLWCGGIDNQALYTYKGYNDSLIPGEWTCTDQFGFTHGDSLPLSVEKPAKTVRIVLTGGSVMKGFLQSWPVIKMFDYPQGCYDYPTSISGKLRKILASKRPDLHWEVINTAVMMHQFNQSLSEYYEKIHDVNPDIIINLDGYNDDWLSLDFKYRGDPYRCSIVQGKEGVDMEMLKKASQWGYTSMLLWFCLANLDMESPKDDNLSSVINKTSIDDFIHMVIQGLKNDTVKEKMSVDSFSYIDPFMRKNMAKQLWLIASFENQMRSDSIYSIFCFQPILARKECQKKLSRKEQAMLNYLDPDKQEIPIIYDSSFLRIFEGYAPDLVAAFNKTGLQKYLIKQYYHRYFINNYISPAIDSVVTSHGGSYIDMGKAMIEQSASIEFYLDYTHLTPSGNEFIAEQMANEVLRCPKLRKTIK